MLRVLRWSAFGLVAVALALAASTVAFQAVRVRAVEKVHAVGARLGMQVQLGDIALRWTGGMRVRDVGLRVASADGRAHIEAGARALDAEFGWNQIFAGERMPTSISLHGSHIAISAPHTDALVWLGRELQSRLNAGANTGGEQSNTRKRRLPDLALQGAVVKVDLGAHEGRFVLETGEVRWLDDAELGTWVKGTVYIEQQEARVEGALRLRRGEPSAWSAQLSIAPPLQIQLPELAAHGIGKIALGGIQADSSGRLVIERLEAEIPEKLAWVQVGRVELVLPAWPTSNAVQAPSQATVSGFQARYGANTAAWASLDVRFAPSPSRTLKQWTSAPLDGLALLDRITVAGLSASIPDRKLVAAVDHAEVQLAAVAGPSPDRRLQSVLLHKPRLQWETEARPTFPSGAQVDDEWIPDELPPVDELPTVPSARKPKKGTSTAPEPPVTPPAGPAAERTPSPPWEKFTAQLMPFLPVATEIREGELSVRFGTDDSDRVDLKGLELRWTPPAAERGASLRGAARFKEADGSAAIELSADFDLEGALQRLQLGTSGDRLARLLPDFSSHLRASPNAELSLDFNVQRHSATAWRGTASLLARGVGFQWWRIAHAPVDGLDFELELDGTYDRATDTLTAHLPLLRFGGGRMNAELSVARLTGTPAMKLHVSMPKQACDPVFRAIPPALIPRLEGIRVQGSMWFDLDLNVDLQRLENLTLNLDGELNTCRVYDMGKHVDLGILKSRRFVHRPFVGGEVLNVPVGPGTKWWVPLDDIPSYVAMGAVATEDLDFFVHNGFKISLIRRAMKMDLERQRYVYGGSTISQQLVKNLFLSREKTMARKIEEAIITWQMEQEVSKHRILELYLNCIEYGPEIYGIRMAAKHYFGKEPRDLTPLEGAFLMGNKPCPSCGYRQWKRGSLDERWKGRMQHIMKRLRDRGWITPEQFAAESHFSVTFAGAGRGR